ncbi:MAG: M28 family peptidase [Bacteroidales bacterium]|nr:M28 family peptidase [Bacteroidales bacterium]
MNKSTLFAALSGVILFSLLSCQNTQHNNSGASATVKEEVLNVDFSADSAYQYTAEQVAFGPRVPGTEAHGKCLDYLASTLARFGAEVEIQEGDGTNYLGNRQHIKNVIGRIQPQKANRVILCAHWDSRPWSDNDKDAKVRDTPVDGANDGASGVGVLLEVARQLQLKQSKIGVDIIFFDVEDMGTPSHKNDVKHLQDTWCLGSQMWGQSDMGKRSQARFAILLDMVGAPNATFYRESFSMQWGSNIVDNVWGRAHKMGFGSYFVNSDGGYITDDHYYIHRHTKIPAIDIIQYDSQSNTSFGSYWHTQQDTMDNVDKATLNAVGSVVLGVLYNEK